MARFGRAHLNCLLFDLAYHRLRTLVTNTMCLRAMLIEMATQFPLSFELAWHSPFTAIGLLNSRRNQTENDKVLLRHTPVV